MTASKEDEHRLRSIQIESAVSAFTGEPFCLVAAFTQGGRRIGGQLGPAEVRALALAWLEAAAAAEYDAALVAQLREARVSDEVVGSFIHGLRERRRPLELDPEEGGK